MQTKCKNCGTVSPIRTDICDKCGSMSFVPLDEKETKSVSEILDAKKEEERVKKEKIDKEKKEIDEKAKNDNVEEEEKSKSKKDEKKEKKDDKKKK